jgi:hypothetical protein
MRNLRPAPFGASLPFRHCERSEAIQSGGVVMEAAKQVRQLRLDCFVASLLAMTAANAWRWQNSGADAPREAIFIG